jgi:predicted transcriptional regulator
MSAFVELDYTRSQRRLIEWTDSRTKAAYALARGYSKTYAAEQAGVTRCTIYNWLDDPEFSMEVDRLTLMVDVAGRAERLREAMRILRARRLEDGSLQTEKDTLDWMKYVQSETDGAKIDLSKLAEYLAGESAQQGDGPSGLSGSSSSISAPQQLGPAIDVEAQAVVDDGDINPS